MIENFWIAQIVTFFNTSTLIRTVKVHVFTKEKKYQYGFSKVRICIYYAGFLSFTDNRCLFVRYMDVM